VIIYRCIKSYEDVLRLQEDIDTLSEWADTWLMTFNLTKCEHLTVTNKRSPINSSYKIHDHMVQQVTSTKYLGVTINHNLSWSNHITQICSKANSVLAFLRRNLRQCSTAVKSLAYFTYVQPIVEYASTVWSPHIKADINKLEMIQRRAARFVLNNYSRFASVTRMLDILKWPTLENRRNTAKIIMFYKILHGHVCVEFHNYLHPNRSSTRGHNLRFMQLPTSIDAYLYSFLPSTIRLWNSLPAQLMQSLTLTDFKYNLYVHYTH